MSTDTHQPPPDNVVPPTEIDRRRRVLACTEDLADLIKDAIERTLELHDLGVSARDWVPMVASHGPRAVGALIDQYGGFLYGFIDGFIDARLADAKTGSEGMVAAMVGAVKRSFDAPSDLVQSRPEQIAQLPIAQLPDDIARNCLGLEASRIRNVLKRLFAEAPKLTGKDGQPVDDQAPALECHVMLKAGGQFSGALSVTPEGTLRLLAMNEIQQRGGPSKAVMVEHFFDYEQIADVALMREVKATEGSRIVTS
jgi:hypothetical protein